MTAKEAVERLKQLSYIKSLESVIYYCNDENKFEQCNKDFEAVSMAIKALEKSMPKNPKGNLNSVPHFRCPKCNCIVKSFFDRNDIKGDNYCSSCGQKLKWG